MGQVIAGRVLDFHGRALGKEKAPESQQRLNRHVAQLMHGMRKQCFPHDETADAIACTDTRITDDPSGMIFSMSSPKIKPNNYGIVLSNCGNFAGAAASSSRVELRAMVRGIKALEKLDDEALALQLRKVSALYQAANSPPESFGNDRCVSRNEMLIRRSLPWCVAAGVLVRMRNYKLD